MTIPVFILQSKILSLSSFIIINCSFSKEKLNSQRMFYTPFHSPHVLSQCPKILHVLCGHRVIMHAFLIDHYPHTDTGPIMESGKVRSHYLRKNCAENMLQRSSCITGNPGKICRQVCEKLEHFKG